MEAVSTAGGQSVDLDSRERELIVDKLKKEVETRVAKDALSLQITLRDAVQFIGILATAGVLLWSMKSDIRDIATRLQEASKLTEANNGLLHAEISAVKDSQQNLARQIALIQAEQQDMKMELAKRGLYTQARP